MPMFKIRVRSPLPLLFSGLLIVAAQASDAADLPAGFDCVITPSQSVDLGSPVPGQLAEVSVDRSDRVSADQVVARLDSRLEEANLVIAALSGVVPCTCNQFSPSSRCTA